MLYEVEENNHPDWFNKDPWYNTAICYKLDGKSFEDLLKSQRTNRYNFTRYIIEHDKQQPTYVDDESSGGGRPIPNNSTT